MLERYRDSTLTAFPRDEDIPLDGVVKDDWRDLVEDEKQPGRINRISYEVCLLATLREKVRCKEVWVQGAQRFRNPDEDCRRISGSGARSITRRSDSPWRRRPSWRTVREKLETALTAFDVDVPHNPKVQDR